MFPPLLILLLTSSSPSIAGEPDESRKVFIVEAVSLTGRIARPEIEIFNARPSPRLPAFTGEDLHPNAVDAYRDYTHTIQQLKELNQASSALSVSFGRLSRAYTGQLNPPAEIPIAPALPNTLHEHLTAVADDSNTVRTLLDVDAAKTKAKTMAADGESLAKLMEWLRGDWQRPLHLQRTIQSEQQGPSRRMLLDILRNAERPLADHELVLLGRLLDEQAHEDFLDAFQKYDQLDLRLVDVMPESPRRDHTAMLDVCKTFEKTFGTDNVLYPDILLLETAARMDINSNSYAEEKTEEMLRLLMAKKSYPALEAWAAFSLGEYLFEHHRVDEAAQVYADLLETLEPGDRHYPATMYKLMWSQFRQGRHDAQLQTAARYLRWAPTGGSNYLEPEVIRYSALAMMSLRDLDGAKRSPVSDLQAFDKRLGTGAPLRSIAVDLAEVFTQTAQPEMAIEVVEYLYQTWPMHPDSPNQVWQAAKLYRTTSPPNAEKSVHTLQLLKEKYHEKSDWWRANRHNQSAIEKVEEYLKEVLASQAIDSHYQGHQNADPAAYDTAREHYAEYLRRFPAAIDAHEMRWYYANTLMKLSRLEEAGVEFAKLLKSTDDHAYKDGSMWNLMQARRQIVIDTYGEIATLPPDAVVEKEITLPKGGTHSVYTLSEEHRLFIESVEAIAEAKFSDQNYQATLDKSRAALVYLAGQIPHVHGRFEEALPRLISVMTQFPDSPEALWARAMVFEELTTDPSSAVNLQAETSCNAWRTVVHSGLAEAKPIPLEGLLAAGTEYINTCGAKRIDRNLVDDVIQRTTKTTGATAPLIAAIWQQGPISRTMKRQLNKDLKRMLAAEDEGALELCRDLRDRASGLTACAAAASQKRPHDKAKVAASDAESSEHAESIRSVVRRKKSQVQYCYEKRLKENPNISGRLVIMVDIDKGRVTQVRIEANKTGDKEIESCVKSKVKRWRFSPETTDSIVLPFALSSK